ncbi:hypothetical protein [Aeromonas hydrophila]|uniref:hypothetical protein n=1 Tax=Aeromonas hydrophila TaxID=644 RepID=UPI003D1D2B99
MNTYGEFWVYDKSGVLANEFTVTDNLAGMAVSEVVVTEGIVLGSSDATDAAKRADASAIEAKKSEQNAAATLANTYTKSEIDNKVTDAGYGLKQVQLFAPTGAPTTGYVPIIFTNVNHNEYCYISTKPSGSSDPMNNCAFDGIVRSGGWTDRGSYVTGQFNIYAPDERALHSIHTGTEADNFYVAYVEVRAFPVTVKVPVGVNVATNTTVSYGTSVFVTNGQNDVGNTKGFKICDFNKGSGLYRNGNRVYDQGFKPTPADVGTLSESVINTELNKKFDKVGGTITGLTSIEGRTTLGAYSIKRSGVTGYANFGQLAVAGTTGEAVLGIGTNQESVTSYLKVGDDKLEFVSNDLPKKVYHAGNKPSATDLNVVGRYSLETTSDLRSLRNGGMYRLSDTVVGGPENQLMAYGQLLHVNGAADTHMQILGNYQSSKLYWRGFNNTNLGGNWRKVYHDGDMPTPTEIGALPITGGTLTGNLIVKGEIRSGSAISYYSNNTNLGIILSSNAAGYTEIVRNSNTGEYTDGLRSYGGADWRIGTNRIYTQGFKPSPGDLGAVSSSGDTITGQIRYSAPFNGTSANAQISHIGNDAGQSLFIRNMREHNSSTLLWEKVYGGSLYYATGVNGAGASKIRMAVSQGDIYLGDANKRVYHEGFKPTAADVGTYTQAQVDAMIAKLKTDNGLK